MEPNHIPPSVPLPSSSTPNKPSKNPHKKDFPKKKLAEEERIDAGNNDGKKKHTKQIRKSPFLTTTSLAREYPAKRKHINNNKKKEDPTLRNQHNRIPLTLTLYCRCPNSLLPWETMNGHLC